MNFSLRHSGAHITYIGHATLLVEMEGVRLLTDPILRNRVSFLRRHDPTRLDATLCKGVDAVLVSHLHRDHLDLPSLRLLGHSTHLIVPHGTGGMLRRHGFRVVEELRIGDQTRVGSLKIIATYADHDPARDPFGLKADALGYVIQGRHSIYFPGDTDIFPGMANLSDELDVALLPVWGWGPTLGPGHMNPLRAAEALTLLQPRLAIPIHWGVLRPTGIGWLKPNYLTIPPHTFAHYAAKLAPAVDIRIMQPGDSVSLDKSLA